MSSETRGLYRETAPGTDVGYATVLYGLTAAFGTMPERQYRERGYLPDYDQLPGKAAFLEKRDRRNPSSTGLTAR